MPSAFIERSFIRSLVSEPDNCFALFYFVINADISHVIMTLIRYFLIPKSRDLVSHNPGISGLKKGPGSRDPGIRDPGIAIPSSSPGDNGQKPVQGIVEHPSSTIAGLRAADGYDTSKIGRAATCACMDS